MFAKKKCIFTLIYSNQATAWGVLQETPGISSLGDSDNKLQKLNYISNSTKTLSSENKLFLYVIC